jgi:hypothetical protein
MSSFAEKVVDIDIAVHGEQEHKATIPPPKVTGKLGTIDTTEADEVIYNIGTQMSNYARSQKYYRTRENRNFDTVKSTESRVFWFAAIESCLIISMAFLQVYAVRSFFNIGGARGRL